MCLATAGAATGEEPGWLRSSRLVGDPGGARTRLENLGVELQLFYHQVLAGKPAGGGANPDGVFGYSGSYDFFARVDVEELAAWPGLDVLLHVKGQYDRNVNDDVGALSSPIDDADFDEPIYVDELWIQQELAGDRLRLRLGFLEQQTVFDRNAYANSEDRQFLSTFLDNNPVVPLPNGLGAVVIAVPWSQLEVALGAADADNLQRRMGFDTAFDGVDSVSGYLELVLRAGLPAASGELPGTYRAGMFIDGGERPVFGTPGPGGAPRAERGHLGAYLSLDQVAYREEPEGREGLGLFARFGLADEDTNRIAWFWSLGLQYVGLMPARGEDVLGLGVYHAIGSHRYRETVDPDFDGELGVELYYRIAALPWLAITPDFQYIANPGGSTPASDVFVGALRIRISF